VVAVLCVEEAGGPEVGQPALQMEREWVEREWGPVKSCRSQAWPLQALVSLAMNGAPLVGFVGAAVDADVAAEELPPVGNSGLGVEL
jgi:hypothetical protein